MNQYGGEGKEAYKSTKNDSSLKQQGGEGQELKMGGDMSLLKCDSNYAGPGYHLGQKSY